MNYNTLLETLSDISYIAGELNYFSGDSRADISNFIIWAQEFEVIHGPTDWTEKDYIEEIRKFASMKIAKEQ